MSTNTSIQWTDRTWNPVRGCSIVSPGCVNCYAMKQAHRFSGPGKPYEGLTKQTKAGPQWTGKVVPVESSLLEPLSWKKPQRVFVNSMSDLFHEDVPDAFIDKVFAVMALAPRHTFQILTKRADRMRDYVSGASMGCGESRRGRVIGKAWEMLGRRPLNKYRHEGITTRPWPLPNVWLGVSCEDQQRADERIPLLLQTPAAVRFISAEPLLGPLDLDRFLWREAEVQPPSSGIRFEWGMGLDWVIVGGESGPGARPCRTEWIADIVKQCHAASVPVFVKQMGSVPYVRANRLRHWEWRDIKRPEDQRFTDAHDDALGWRVHLADRKGGDPVEWPEDLRVREFPSVLRHEGQP